MLSSCGSPLAASKRTELSERGSPSRKLNEVMGSSRGNNLLKKCKDMLEAAENFADNSPVGIGSSLGNIDEEQHNLNELGNASGNEFEIPASFDEQIGIDSHMSADWGLGHDIHYSKLTQSMKIPNNTTCHLQTCKASVNITKSSLVYVRRSDLGGTGYVC